MSLQAMARAALGQIVTLFPESVVTVAQEGESCSGVRDTTPTDANMSDMGEVGLTTGTVRVNASQFTTPERGAQITVDGEKVIVTETHIDSNEAILTIRHQSVRPVEGV